MIKYALLLISLYGLTSCTHGNCRSQIEQAEATSNAPVKSTVELSNMKQTSVGQRVKVYKSDGTLQCGQGQKISLDDMKKELKEIKVYSQENKNDGKMRIQLCGSPTGQCNIFEIDRENLDKALNLGFKEWISE